jgi:hypothetical protein
MTTIIVRGYQVELDESFDKLSPQGKKETVAEIEQTIAAREAHFAILIKGTVFRLHGVDPAAIAKAREAGYSDDEIVAHFAAQAPEQFKQAKLAGYTSKEILGFLAENKQQAIHPKEAHQILQTGQITTADKINGALAVFAQPQFYLQLGLALIVLFIFARAKRTAHSISSRVGRLGLVLHWGALLIAVVLLGLAGLLLAEAPKTNDTAMWVAGGLAASAVIVWLIGKSLRYILTGPTAAPTPPKPRAEHLSAFSWRVDTFPATVGLGET